MARSNRSKLLWCAAAPWLAAAFLELLVAGLDLAPPRAPPITFWTARQDVLMQGSRAVFRPSPHWLWEPVPGAIIDRERVNSESYRGPLIPRERSAGLRVVVLGESAAYGMLVSDADSWPRRLEASLRARGIQVEVVNLAVTGFSIAQGRERYRHHGREYHPDIVLACFGGLNEHWPAPGGIGDVRKLELTGRVTSAVLEVLQRSAGARWMLSLCGARTTPSTDARLARVSLDEYRTLALALLDDVREGGAELVLVRPAFSRSGLAKKPIMSEYGEALSSLASQAGIALADAHAAFRAREAEQPVDPALPSPLFLDEWHPSPEGHALFAAEVEQALERAGLLARDRIRVGAVR